METVVDEEAKVKDNFTEINGTTISPPKTDDPVVYHLVRVVGDGTLVPATDDQVMTVKDLLDDEKIEGRIISDTAQTLKCAHSGSDLNKQFKISEGLLQHENLEVDAEKLGLPPDLEVDSEKMDIRDEEIHQFTSDDIIDQSRPSEGCSKLSGLAEDGTSTSAIGISMMPDFSLLKGEIQLDNLTMKELQETFKATFGRETSVKDKRWLKRRIIMGLTNSCDFSATTLVITDNRVVKKGKRVDCLVQSSWEDTENSTCFDNQKGMHSNGNRTKVQSFTTEENCGSKDGSAEERPAKRVRKPTRRYIEELSEEESRDSGAKIISSGRQSPACYQPSAKVHLIPVQTVVQDGKCLMRQDSLGGSGVQVPYVSRVRRSRPRESFMTLMKLQLSDMGLPTSLVKNTVSCSEKLRSESLDKVFEDSLSPRLIEVPVSFPEEGMPQTEKEAVQLEKEVVSQNVRLEKEVVSQNVRLHSNVSDDELVTVAKENGGTRRKHHRPWSLSEVVKLVEGVAKYGAGRWSEIKRSAFVSCSYRTSVDLKDKWRNLLRASLAESPTRNGMHTSSRKNASVPIPAQILSRVRELADNPAQIPPNVSDDGNPHEWHKGCFSL